MDILLAIAVMVVAVASWFIAAALRTQIRQNAAELEQARKQIEQVGQTEQRMAERERDQAGLTDFYQMVQQQIGDAREHLARHDDEMRQDQERAAGQEMATARLDAALRREARQREKDIARLEQAFHGKLTSQLSTGLQQEARQRRQEIQQLQQALRDLGRRAEQAGPAVTPTAVRGEDSAAGADGLRGQTEQQLASVAGVLSDIDQHLSAIRQYVRAQLDREVAMTRGNKGHRVLVGGICAEQPAAAGALPLLYESFLSELPVDMLFHDCEHESSDRFYLLWSSQNGQSPEHRLEMLLRGCARDGGKPDPGLNELRGLLLALHQAGPGTLQVGPLVVIRTRRELMGTVLAVTEASLLDGRATLPAPEECRVLLQNVGRDRMADLGAWADSHS
jgi:predicted  nucleic acid-binding Zn-ribbon protein